MISIAFVGNEPITVFQASKIRAVGSEDASSNNLSYMLPATSPQLVAVLVAEALITRCPKPIR
jgi:hypothetical protein